MRLNTKTLPEILFMLIATDALFIVLHLLHTYSRYFADLNYSLEQDRGFAEVFQYIKEYWVILIFCWLSILKAEKSYLAWSLIFGYLLLDDSFRLHERIGLVAVAYFQYNPMPGLRAEDFGELTVVVLAGAFCLLIIGTAYYCGSKEFKRSFGRIMTGLILLVAFGVVIDMAHVMVGKSSFFYKVIGVIEDGGEMLVMSGICWYVLGLLVRARSLSSVASA